MRINLISFYFPPENGAASLRIWNMAKGLQVLGNDIAVFCPHPNYPTGKVFEGYGSKAIEEDQLEEILVRRHWIYPSNSKNGAIRLLSMITFSLTLFLSIPFMRRNKPEVTFVNSPPLFTGIAGVLICRLLRSKCVLNVSDLWPRSALELKAIKPGVLYNVLSRLEIWMYTNSDMILTQSEESKEYIETRVPQALISLYRNLPARQAKVPFESKRENFKIVYAGLLGVAQGLYDLIQNIDFKSLGVELHIYGEGNERDSIARYISNKEACQIYYHGFINEGQLNTILPSFHAALIPLTTTIYGAFPSKIFMAMKFGLPILFSGSGEGKEFVETLQIGFTNNPGEFDTLRSNIEAMVNLSESDYSSLRKRCIQLMENRFSQDQQIVDLILKLKHLINER